MTTASTTGFDGERWLNAALTAQLPEPARARWQPLRVGIVNLWEYDQAEFWFADGRLVLRGGNGAGKTKVLELTTLMLLRGDTSPAALDPFGSQHRTMRYNLLPTGEGDDPRPPTDSGLGYAWAEFGRIDEQGRTHFLVCGLGAYARRGTGTGSPGTWRFITELRPGADLELAVGGRALDEKELRKQHGVTVIGSPATYREQLAHRLFGLEIDAYDNLTELLKQLRKPKLGERLNPGTLAETLRDALPPLAGNEIDQLAEGWDRLEALRTAVEQTNHAAVQVASFVRSGWRPWARVIARRRADALVSATTSLDNTTRDRRDAQSGLEAARLLVSGLGAQLADKRAERSETDTALRELLESSAYQDAVAAAGRVENLKSQLDSLRKQHLEAEGRVATALGHRTKAERAVVEAQRVLQQAKQQADEQAARARTAAEDAGLADSASRHLPAADLAAMRSDLERRAERASHARFLHGAFAEADREVEGAARDLKRRQADLDEAEDSCMRARTAWENAIEALQQALREWAATCSVATFTREQIEDWCDLAAALGDDENGERSVTAAVRANVREVREGVIGRRQELVGQLEPLLTEQLRRADELTRVEAEQDAPPTPPALWLRRERPEPDRAEGAPLWRCVTPAAGLAGERLDVFEAALAASGLLDAWLAPDGRVLTGEAETCLSPDARTVHEHSLADVLDPTPVGGLSREMITGVLGAIGWYTAPQGADTVRDRAWLGADGSWRLGPLSGRALPHGPASYLGATARQAARQRRIDELRALLGELDERLGRLRRAAEELRAQIETLGIEERRVPGDRPVLNAAITVRERERNAETLRGRVTAAQTELQRREVIRDERWAAFAGYAGQHGLPLRDLDRLDRALDDYRSALAALASELTLLSVLSDAEDRAKTDLETRTDEHADATGLVEDLAGEARLAEVRLRTAEQALGADHREQLERRETLDAAATRLEGELSRFEKQHGDARVAVATAESVLNNHEGERKAAEIERDTALERWWHVVDAGLAAPLGIEAPERRVVETALQSARAVRRDLQVRAEPADEDRAWRRCLEQLEELRHELLPDRDARVREDLEADAIQQVAVLADSTAGWQPPDQAAATLAGKVRELEEGFDLEQQRVLTTLLGSTFIEHLKDRLDYTERTFADINRQLETHATRHGHAVRLVWAADPGDPDAGAVVTALSQGYRLLSPERQTMVRQFLARRIDAARAEANAGGTVDWKRQLATALDYRGWLHISLQFRPGAQSGWTAFDTARHGAKSGGEKVILLSQPLFAAAVVAYNAAGELAPRCVWLDEAMTGVDAAIKAKFMGLTVNFDLDVMLTAHDEWCTYQTVPAVAVYDLARQEHLPGVDAMPYLWNGGELTAVDTVTG